MLFRRSGTEGLPANIDAGKRCVDYHSQIFDYKTLVTE